MLGAFYNPSSGGLGYPGLQGLPGMQAGFQGLPGMQGSQNMLGGLSGLLGQYGLQNPLPQASQPGQGWQSPSVSSGQIPGLSSLFPQGLGSYIQSQFNSPQMQSLESQFNTVASQMPPQYQQAWNSAKSLFQNPQSGGGFFQNLLSGLPSLNQGAGGSNQAASPSPNGLAAAGAIR